MTRVPQVDRNALSEPEREALDQLVGGNRGAMPPGPGSIAAHSPEMAILRAPLSSYLRYGTTIPAPILELAILTAARCTDCPYVWNAHASAARKAGVAGALVDALRDRLPLPASDDDETAVVRYAMELMTTHRVSQETFDDAQRRFGTQHLVELTAVLGSYAMNALFLNAFDVDLPAGGTEPPLPV
jgi:4-carboxymuconolactone decarboxylase